MTERRRGPRTRDVDGFTLIELLIVVAIIGLIAAIAIPAMGFALDRSKQRATLSDMRMVGGAIMQYYVDHSAYPDPSQTISQLVGNLAVYSGEGMPETDRWAHDFSYSSDLLQEFTLESFGRDGLDGSNVTHATRNSFELDLVFSNGMFSNSPER